MKVWRYRSHCSCHHHSSPPHVLRGLFPQLLQIHGCFLFFKLKHSITLYCSKSKIVLKCLNFCLPYLYFSSHQSFDLTFSSFLSQAHLCSSCLFKSYVSLEISFKISSLSLSSLFISPLATIYLTL